MSEMLVVAVFALIIFGPKRLPEIARSAGRALREFRHVTGELTEELKAGFDEPAAYSTPAAPEPKKGQLSIERENVKDG